MQNGINKLELVRREGICKLLLKTYEKNQEVLKDKIKQVSGSYPKELKVIFKLNKGQLISIVENSDIPQRTIDETFNQYRYGLKPGFMIFYFNAHESSSNLNIKEAIEEKLKLINYDEEAKYKKLILKAEEEIIENEMIEYSFTYLKRYPYIDEKEQPNAIYELEECFVWVSTTNNFIAIKNSPNQIIRILKRVFSEIYETELNNIKLNNKLVEKIFGNDRRKATAINIDPNNKNAEKITISDRNFKDKGLDKALEGYDITGDSLNITVDDVKNILGLNREKGKLYLTKNMTAKSFRTWSTQTIKRIVDYLTDNEEDFETFCAMNILSGEYWKTYNSKVKKIIEEVCYNIYIYFTKGKENSILKKGNIKECQGLKNYFYGIDLIECPICNEIVFPSCDCGGNIIIGGEKIFCEICGKELNKVFCEDGHKIDLNEDSIVTYYYPKIELLNNIRNTIKKNFSINFQGAFILNGENNLSIIEESKGYLVNINDVKEFYEMNQLKIEDKEKENLILELQRLKEKCKGGKCNNCNKECLMKIFTTYNGYRPSAHQGHEFGDITFEVNYKNEKLQFVGIAKSYIKSKSGNFTLGSSQAGEMIRQILCATYDKRIEIIGAICPNRFDDQLRQTIRYISQVTKTKICIFDDDVMLKQLKYYKMYKNKKEKNFIERK